MSNKVCVSFKVYNTNTYLEDVEKIWICFEVSLSVITQIKSFICAIFRNSKVVLLILVFFFLE